MEREPMEELTTSEALLMKCIWTIGGDVPLADLGDEVEKRFGKKWKRTTIRTFLTHMEAKQFIQIYQVGRNSFIKVLIKEDCYREEQVQKMKEMWFDGSMSKFVSAMYQGNPMSEEDRNAIRKLLDNAKED